MSFRILGTGSSVPRRAVTNDELAQFLDTSDAWIVSRTGIRERRVCTEETITGLAAAAAKAALADAGIAAGELDYILCTTIMGDYLTPSLSCMVQRQIGANCPSFDINAACSGFLYALDAAASFFEAGRASKILIVSAEEMSRHVDWSDRSTCVLFGDGAGAVVLEKGEDLLGISLLAQGGAENLRIPVAPTGSPFAGEARKQGEKPALFMNGQEIYKFAVSHSAKDLQRVLEEAGISCEEVRYFLLHQANCRIIETIRQRMKQPPEKFPMTIAKYGNTSSSSIPIMLDELNRSGGLANGDVLAMSAFGAGLTTGACIVRWSKQKKGMTE